jgi:hypothetical protein
VQIEMQIKTFLLQSVCGLLCGALAKKKEDFSHLEFSNELFEHFFKVFLKNFTFKMSKKVAKSDYKKFRINSNFPWQ